MTVAKKVAKAKKPRAKTLPELLNVIDKALAKQDTTAKKLWDVLTALRGPDYYPDFALKRTGTVPIRRAAFPLTAELADSAVGYVNGADFLDSKYVAQEATGHVRAHVRNAARALGLQE